METLIKEILEYINMRTYTMIGISGHGGSGKTIFSNRLCQAMEEGSYNHLNTDPYIINGEYRRQLEAVYEYEGTTRRFKPTACMPAAHELMSLQRDLKELRKGNDIHTIEKDWMPEMKLSGKKKVTVIDGMSVAFIDKSLLDLSIYIYTDGETELKRRLKRDVTHRGRSIEALYHSHEDRRIQYEFFMHPESKKFDILINNSNDAFTVERKYLS